MKNLNKTSQRKSSVHWLLFIVYVAATVGFSLPPSAAYSSSEKAPYCGAYPAAEAEYLCECLPNSAQGSVWGSGPYTADSSICAAARHAGVIDTQGGLVQTIRRPGQNSYEGSVANGITTSGWGAYATSFSLVNGTDQIAACSVMPSGATFLQCRCDPGLLQQGQVWGVGPYTSDSNICSAARHAGLIAHEGGIVEVLSLGGLSSYSGSSAHGQTTSAWGQYGASITFNRN
ncbi:LCCL domain-containing protein [Shimia gijangensis]|uniref:LCCL domain-containing protein n=1 Tax=Shimia gijangensis TaxID=1470563 RepID=A0A1M6QUC7_9RHOB|nr:LCCL domain-containing protein [Shimia gijangensis]